MIEVTNKTVWIATLYKFNSDVKNPKRPDDQWERARAKYCDDFFAALELVDDRFFDIEGSTVVRNYGRAIVYKNEDGDKRANITKKEIHTQV